MNVQNLGELNWCVDEEERLKIVIIPEDAESTPLGSLGYADRDLRGAASVLGVVKRTKHAIVIDKLNGVMHFGLVLRPTIDLGHRDWTVIYAGTEDDEATCHWGVTDDPDVEFNSTEELGIPLSLSHALRRLVLYLKAGLMECIYQGGIVKIDVDDVKSDLGTEVPNELLTHLAQQLECWAAEAASQS